MTSDQWLIVRKLFIDDAADQNGQTEDNTAEDGD